ncbi:hypothetical protein B0H10DRAFT_1803248, partial [Mycena sp. CBHHK59/15]
RLRADRKKIVQALPTNAEREVENNAMQHAMHDFDTSSGIEPEKCDNILSWLRRDGASHATLLRLKKIPAASPNIYHSFRNRGKSSTLTAPNVISSPETWHTKVTHLNLCASYHYGPAAAKDPSSLSRSSNAANIKRPTDFRKCDFYPASRSMTMTWEAQVLHRLLEVYIYFAPYVAI